MSIVGHLEWCWYNLIFFILIFFYFYFYDFDAILGQTLQPRSQFFNPSPYFQSIPLTMIQLCCDMTTMVTFTSPFRATVYPWNCHSGRLTNSAALRNRKSMQKSEWKLRSKYSNSSPQSRFQKVIAYFKKNTWHQLVIVHDHWHIHLASHDLSVKTRKQIKTSQELQKLLVTSYLESQV